MAEEPGVLVVHARVEGGAGVVADEVEFASARLEAPPVVRGDADEGGGRRGRRVEEDRGGGRDADGVARHDAAGVAAGDERGVADGPAGASAGDALVGVGVGDDVVVLPVESRDDDGRRVGAGPVDERGDVDDGRVEGVVVAVGKLELELEEAEAGDFAGVGADVAGDGRIGRGGGGDEGAGNGGRIRPERGLRLLRKEPEGDGLRIAQDAAVPDEAVARDGPFRRRFGQKVEGAGVGAGLKRFGGELLEPVAIPVRDAEKGLGGRGVLRQSHFAAERRDAVRRACGETGRQILRVCGDCHRRNQKQYQFFEHRRHIRTYRANKLGRHVP